MATTLGKAAGLIMASLFVIVIIIPIAVELARGILY